MTVCQPIWVKLENVKLGCLLAIEGETHTAIDSSTNEQSGTLLRDCNFMKDAVQVIVIETKKV